MSNVPHTSGQATQQLPPSYSTTQQPPQQPTQQGMIAAPPRAQVFYQMGPGGQPQVYCSQQPYTAPMQPLVTAPMGATIPVQYPPPNSYIVLSAVVLAICALLNLTSIMFGIPALVLSIQSDESKRQLQYAIAKSRGNVALTLIIINIVYTAASAVLIIGLVLGLRSPYGYRYGYYYG